MRFYTETYGCTMNQGESQDLALALMSLGHQRIDDERDADIVLINTCVVIKPTETKIMRRLRQLNQTGKYLVIAGCIPAVAGDALSMEFPEPCGSRPRNMETSRNWPGPGSGRGAHFSPFQVRAPLASSPFLKDVWVIAAIA